MKRALIGSLLFAVLASSVPAFAQSSDTRVNATPRTRAEVKAELLAARKSGELDAIHSESYPQLAPYQTSSAARKTSE